ncbi:DUF4259 domain-containing protein [Actinocorallia sp. A-T 12471]|uniref:DUF4259 domain-containing protein n=1 Tax=Actinocorallia sp. A-T 12471 TaxID=3089813 RepID=UPI0029CD3330|nr:DUF4259 domain-containing protein [Actinocorallia sp. A-T 12471]MDX6744792.1 DUF4259 domain-containing protein [Actinocorallia sp. A-T 12471]
MGAWDFGPFGNDDALDFAAAVSGAPQAAAETIRAAMESVVRGTEYLDTDEVSAALVGACFVAERIAPGTIENGNGRHHAAGLDFTPSPELVALAVAVFDRAFDVRDNEWACLWDEGGALNKVRAEHAAVEAVLRAAVP